jgi:hypothetical protein
MQVAKCGDDLAGEDDEMTDDQLRLAASAIRAVLLPTIEQL